MPSEQEQFLKDIQSEGANQDPFAYLNEQLPVAESEKPAEESVEQTGDVEPRNRRERRLEARLQAEREAGIQLAARLQALEEQRTSSTPKSEAVSNIERIYGVDSPEAREATEILKSELARVREEATQAALNALEERTSRETQAIREAEQQLDSMLEDIEDEFDVDMTPQARTDFFKLLEKMSPKDKDGNIIQYADHLAVWEDYQLRTQKPVDNTAKNLAARAMTNGAAASDQNLVSSVAERYLREQGII